MYESSDSLEGNWLSKGSVSKQPVAGCATERSKAKTGLIICATLTDVLVVFGIATLEYYFRWTNHFPIRRRQVNLSCNHTSDIESEPESEFSEFVMKAEIPEIAIYIYSFSFPIIMILIGEVIVFIFANQSTKLLPGGPCSPLHIPHTIRRLYRFSLSFLFGIMCLMVIVDSIKIFLGELRPNFYLICRFQCTNQSVESSTSVLYRDDICYEKSKLVLRKARTSCPSMRSAISMYAAIFTTTYMHGIGLIHHSKYIFVPLLNMFLILISIIYGIILVVRKEAWWTDVLIGQILGIAVALYLAFCVLRKFKFQETVSTRRILRQLVLLQNNNRHKDSKEIPKIIDPCLEPVRLRRMPGPCSSYKCHCIATAPLTNALGSNSDDTSTFFPVPKPNRKSVTLPISSPHIPITHHPGDKSDTVTTTPYNAEHRLSAINPSRRHIILSSNMPKISQELINLLHAKQEPHILERDFITSNSKEHIETSIL